MEPIYKCITFSPSVLIGDTTFEEHFQQIQKWLGEQDARRRDNINIGLGPDAVICSGNHIPWHISPHSVSTAILGDGSVLHSWNPNATIFPRDWTP